MNQPAKRGNADHPHVPIPPANAQVVTTCCDYCIVGCGYKAYVWPTGVNGGPTAAQNAYGVDFPVEPMSGAWPTPNQHSHCVVDGKKHNVVVMPDVDSSVVNIGGNHSIRGGCIAKKVYDPDGPTRDRLRQPMLRVDGKDVELSPGMAVTVEVKTGKRRLIEFLLSPLLRGVSESARER